MIENIWFEPKQKEFAELCRRPKKEDDELAKIIERIFIKVKNGGDHSLIALTSKYDHVQLGCINVTSDEIAKAINMVPDSLKKAIEIAKENITNFHSAQLTKDVVVETLDGVICSQKSIGIERVGIYVPGGTAPLFSTVLMLAIPASLAKCKDVILCTPPDKSGGVHPAILYAADLCGASRIYKVGGAQAIAAMTFGTETISSVSKVFGPGNQYVTAAKQYAQKFGVGMDTPAGPSELLVYANGSAIPKFVAADLLSQAEHGPDSQVLLVASERRIVNQVNKEIAKQIKDLPRKDIAKLALGNSKAIVLKEEDNAFEFINTYGPEHLIVAAKTYHDLVPKIINAGSVFLGNYCPESSGDYASGTNHTLPTDGWSKSYSGVNVDSFCRKITFQEISKEGIQNIGDAVMTMAKHEMLDAHANAVKIRLEELKHEEL